MPTVTKAQLDREAREHTALGKIIAAIQEADLTPLQAIDVLARELVDRTKRLSAYEEREHAIYDRVAELAGITED